MKTELTLGMGTTQRIDEASSLIEVGNALVATWFSIHEGRAGAGYAHQDHNDRSPVLLSIEPDRLLCLPICKGNVRVPEEVEVVENPPQSELLLMGDPHRHRYATIMGAKVLTCL